MKKQPKFISRNIAVFFSFLSLATSRGICEDSPQIKDMGGTVLIDSAVEVTGAIQENRYFELVETSTPTTPSANHARVWLNAQGSKQAVKVIFDDGSVVSIAAN